MAKSMIFRATVAEPCFVKDATAVNGMSLVLSASRKPGALLLSPDISRGLKRIKSSWRSTGFPLEVRSMGVNDCDAVMLAMSNSRVCNQITQNFMYRMHNYGQRWRIFDPTS